MRTLIVAKIQPGSAPDIARIFADSDATSLPHDLGVAERSLYALDDLYVHLIDFRADGAQAMSELHTHQGFRDISERLARHVSPYRPAWRSPQDAIADRFYHWQATTIERQENS